MSQVRRTLAEFVVVTVVGTVVGLAANELNTRGVNLGTDYHPRGLAGAVATRSATQPSTAAATAPASPENDELQLAIEAIQNDGLQPISHAETLAMFNDPMYAAGAYVFVDDRNDEAYQHGHIPGAYQFDHYQEDRYLNEVLPACRQAFKVVVYCTGGECEDSRFGALILIRKGLDPGRVFVYPGGFAQWRQSDLPVERGGRASGDVVPGSQVGAGHDR